MQLYIGRRNVEAVQVKTMYNEKTHEKMCSRTCTARISVHIQAAKSVCDCTDWLLPRSISRFPLLQELISFMSSVLSPFWNKVSVKLVLLYIPYCF